VIVSFRRASDIPHSVCMPSDIGQGFPNDFSLCIVFDQLWRDFFILDLFQSLHEFFLFGACLVLLLFRLLHIELSQRHGIIKPLPWSASDLVLGVNAFIWSVEVLIHLFLVKDSYICLRLIALLVFLQTRVK